MYRILIIFLFYSCASIKENKEYIELRHNGLAIINRDDLLIKLIPTHKKRKRPVIVKTIVNGERFDNRRISNEKYKQIFDIIWNLQQKDVELPQNKNYMVGIIDGGSNAVYLRKDTIKKEIFVRGISKEYHGKFYEAAELILKSAKLDINHIN